MANGITALRKIQYGEGVPGTPVAATRIWRGTGLLEDAREVKHVSEQVAIPQSTTRAYIPKLGSKVTFDPVEATYQQINVFMQYGIEPVGTPTADGAGTGKIWSHSVVSTTLPSDWLAMTIEAGDNQHAQETSGAFCESFKISGSAGEGVMMEGTFIGQDVVDTTFTAALAVPTLAPDNHIVFGGSNLYIDAVGGTIGTTELTSTLLSFELDVTTGLKAKYTNKGKDFDFIYFDEGSYSATLKLVYEHNASADGQRDLYEVATPRLVRLKFEGAALTTGGTDYDNETFIIDAPGVYTAMPLGDVDGNATYEAEMQLGYDLTAALGLSFTVVNQETFVA